MKECKNCNVKDFYARAFDLHWLDEYDCPVICPYITDLAEDRNDNDKIEGLCEEGYSVSNQQI